MKHVILFSTIALALCPAAQARYCHSPQELESKVQDCEQNAYYAEAAVLCVTAFKNKVDKVAGATGKSLGKSVAKMQDAQDKNFDTTGKSYQLSEAALAGLIAEGEARLAEADAYLDQVVFPEDIGEAGKDASQLLSGSECYKRNSDVISLVKKDFTKKLNELKAARAAAAGLRGISDSRETKIGGDTSTAAPQTTGGKNTGPKTPAYKGEDKRGHSDISGTEDVKKKK